MHFLTYLTLYVNMKDPYIPVPDSSQHRHLNSFRYRTDRMPNSPAFWHLKHCTKGKKATPCTCILPAVKRDTPCTSTLLMAKLDTPCTSTLLMVFCWLDTPCMSIWDTPCTMHICTAGGGEGYTLHVHTAGAVDGYTLHVHTAGYGYTPHVYSDRNGKGIHPAHPHFMREKKIHPHVYSTSGGKEPPPPPRLHC
jgi:hypothetical protein